MTKVKKKHFGVGDQDDLDLISAIWILTSNDANSIITYEGIRYRLELSAGYDVKQLVASRVELFRPSVSQDRLDRWKEEMRHNRSLPGWISDIPDPAKRAAQIDALTTDDVFRTQFRAAENAPPSSVEIIDWGLQHVDRLRRAGLESREERFKWITGLAFPIASMLIAIAALLSNAYLENRRRSSDIESKKYETTFRLKEQAYVSFMKGLWDAYDKAYRAETPSLFDKPALYQSLDHLEGVYHSIEPFLDKPKNEELWIKYQEFASMCLELQKSPKSTGREKYHEQFIAFRSYFQSQLYDSLFPR